MPIGERPLLEYWLQTLWQSGVREVLVNLHYLPTVVEEFLARPRFQGWVHSVREPELLGTAGSLRANTDFFQGDTVLLVHADNWCQCQFGDFLNFHLEERPTSTSMTMMTFDSDNPQSCGIVETVGNGIVRAFHEKVAEPPGTRANAAVYLLEPEVLQWVIQHPEVSDFSNEVLPNYLGQIATWHNAQIHRDIGTIETLRQAQLDQKPDAVWGEIDAWQQWFLQQPIHQQLRASDT
jgi:mannose-1-phosphate guanylyltransferase